MWICHSRILESRAALWGSERIERLEHLAQEGHDVYLIAAYFDKKRFVNLDLSSRLHLLSVPLKYKNVISTLLYGLVLLLFLPIYIVRVRPDFVISDDTTTPFLLWSLVLSKLLGFKTILDLRGTPIAEGTAKKTTLRARLLFSSSIWIAKTMFNGITIVTSMMRDEICRSFSINPAWTAVLPNGISEKILAPEKERDSSMVLKEQLGLSNKFVVIYHGSFRLTGGLIESIKSMALLKENHPDIILFLLGGNQHKEVIDLLKQTIKENSVGKNVVMHEPVEFREVPKYIAMSNLGLVPLPNIPFWRYQQPIKMLEYMAMEKAFVVSESPAHTSIMSGGKNAIYFAHVTPIEIANAIEYAYASKDKLDEWGKIGRAIILERYVWKKVNQDFISYIQNIKLGKNGHARLAK